MDLPKICHYESPDLVHILQSIDSIQYVQNIYPYTPDSSFTVHFLKAFDILEFTRKLLSMQTQVILVDPDNLCDDQRSDCRLCVFRVQAGASKGKTLKGEGISWEKFINCTHLPRVVLVSSDSVSVVDSKLSVYKENAYLFENNNIRIQHELDPDEILGLYGAKYTIDNYNEQLEKLSKSIPTSEIHGMVEEAANVVFSKGEIETRCQNIEIISEGEKIGSVRDRSYPCRAPWTIRRIKQQLIKDTTDVVGQDFKDQITNKIVAHIQQKLDVEISSEMAKYNMLKNIKFAVKTAGIIVVGAAIQYVVAQLVNPILGVALGAVMFIGVAGNTVMTAVLSVDVNSREWRNKLAEEIYNAIIPRKAEIIMNVVKEIEKLCRNTTRELMTICEQLTSASSRIPLVEQKMQIEEWMMRDFRIENVGSCPSILHFITGRKKGRAVMKVFLQTKDPEAVSFCEKNAVNVPRNAEYEFVDVSVKSDSEKVSAIRKEERKARPISSIVKKKIHKIIKEKRDLIFAKYSNVTAVSASPVKYQDGRVIHEPCIALYCFDVHLIPFGENDLPDSIEGVPCDIREDFIQFGRCENCQALNHGCSVGKYNEVSSGSLGFFVRRKGKPSCGGFLTAAHVALTDDVIAQLNETKLSDCSLQRETYRIVHPSFQDSTSNNVIGKVEDSFFGNHRSVGIDAAFVQTDLDVMRPREEMYESSVSCDVDSDEEYEVVKNGRTTGDTTGDLKFCFFSIRKPFPERGGIYLKLDNCYTIYDIDSPFFLPGDSGAAVFVVNRIDSSRQPLALAFGKMTNYGITFASPLENILEVLNLSIVQPAQPMDMS